MDKLKNNNKKIIKRNYQRIFGKKRKIEKSNKNKNKKKKTRNKNNI